MLVSISRFARQFAAAFILAGSFGLPCLAGTADFVATWTNADPNTQSIASVTITQDVTGLRVAAFGACHPTACPWGAARARVFTHGIDEKPSAGAAAITGSFGKGFSSIEVILEMQGGSSLRYETFTHFKDKSGRSDYFSEGTLTRS